MKGFLCCLFGQRTTGEKRKKGEPGKGEVVESKKSKDKKKRRQKSIRQMVLLQEGSAVPVGRW